MQNPRKNTIFELTLTASDKRDKHGGKDTTFLFSPHHRHTRVYSLLFSAVDDTAILDGAVIDPVRKTDRIPRKLLCARLGVNLFAPAIINHHLQTDKIPFQLRLEHIIETVPIGSNHIGNRDLAGSPVEKDGIVAGVTLNLQTAILRRSHTVVIDRDPQRIGSVVCRQEG